MTNIEEIKKLLDWYDKNSGRAGINALLDAQDKIAIRSYTLAGELAEIKRNYNLSYFDRKIGFNKAKQNFIQKRKMTGTEADANANIEVEELQRVETEYETVGYRLEVLLRQLNKILSALQQRISFLKAEEIQTRSQNQT